MAFAARSRILFSLAVPAVISAVSVARPAAAADTVVQIPVESVLDGRSVSTAAGTAITTWSAGQGVDGDGNADGYVTNAVEAILNTQGKTVGGKIGVALPDDGLFPADARHPAVALHFSNAAATTAPQTHQLKISQGPQSFQFNVPPATYSKLFLFITCSEGAANLTITLNYAAGTPATVTMLKLPDYGIGGAAANDPVFFNLIAGMRKWSSSNQEGDGTSHTITGIQLAPSATAQLTSVQVTKTNGSHAVFWGATGIATSPVDTGAGGSGGMSGVGGAGGSAGTGGAPSAGASSGGNAGAGGIAGSATAGGTSSAGTAGGTPVGQAGSSTSGAPNQSEPSADTNSGCSVSTGAPARRSLAWSALLACCAAAFRRRRSTASRASRASRT